MTHLPESRPGLRRRRALPVCGDQSQGGVLTYALGAGTTARPTAGSNGWATRLRDQFAWDFGVVARSL